ncbi:hypothetical protein LTR10_017568 [Elasticomyces elasticus]|uniref:Uncharacterized protein n=1 Tax=Exophiala sideris TaxID=1016849 RepID=A0ABR0J060_9EURO|nr:hypothetical protein LTR10_017568 [Elasticomyces elasticus]KAK5023425.1 hypothetical protein LTS07_009300 [Exophiala sideris]KAK5028200.1 hypothetical protein LTR13_009188 [Exophiala sideris]KAK5052858.1 hypothetical protein LTR69_009684 [Exophiala sideris]KAK5178469.1 hypothetical protein LTR44_009094 [Eurotiomycetes sp. CCFEE 6388]
MDPKQFGVSTLPYRHEPSGPIADELLVGSNKGKLAVVTGAGRGIGQAIAIALARSSANVAILDLSVESQERTKLACQKFEGVKVEAYKCDITDVQGVRDTFAAINRTFGPVDILVNNAGVAHGKLAFDETFETFWKAIEINFKGTMLCIYEVLQSMRQRKSGCIINMASRAAIVDMPRGISYNSSKAAIVRATASLQEEFELEGLGQHLQTYCLHPGGVWGAMATENTSIEVQQQIRPIFKDVPELCGNTVAYLASGRAKELRGHYFDCRHEIERVCSFGYETLKQYGLYNLGMKFLPGYENEP